MPRGAEDFLNPPYVVAGRQIDPATQVLARFGFVPVDCMGRWWWFDNFREGLASWTLTLTTDTLSPCLSSVHAYVSPYSVRLPSGGTLGYYSMIKRKVYYSRTPGTVGLEFAVRDGGSSGNITCSLYHTFSATSFRMAVMIDWDDSIVWLISPTGWRKMPGWDIVWGNDLWLPIKVVADFSTGFYTRLIIGGDSFDVSDYSVWDQITGFADCMQVDFANQNTEGGNKYTHLGYCLLTVDEP